MVIRPLGLVQSIYKYPGESNNLKVLVLIHSYKVQTGILRYKYAPTGIIIIGGPGGIDWGRGGLTMWRNKINNKLQTCKNKNTKLLYLV